MRQWLRTAEPLGERRYENWNTHNFYVPLSQLESIVFRMKHNQQFLLLRELKQHQQRCNSFQSHRLYILIHIRGTGVLSSCFLFSGVIAHGYENITDIPVLHRGMLCFIFAGLIRLASPDILTNTYMHAVLASVIGR